MVSDTTLMNQLAKKSRFLICLTDEQAAAMKKVLLAMYCDLAKLCREHDIRLLLCGGTCLGAVRHQGFIPWDDDLDVMIPRSDYDRLIALLEEGKLGDNYTYSAPNPHSDSASVWLKIYRKDTIDEDLYNVGTPFPKGIFLDVFALDAVPCSRWAQRLKGLVANGLQYCSILTLYAKYPSEPLRQFMAMDPQLRRRYRIKCILGHIVGVIPRRCWNWWFDRFVASSAEGHPWGIPTGRKYYCGEIFPSSVYLPSVPASFEGVQAAIPGGYDAYLTNLYHDYMQLPPEDKRERHFTYRFQLPAK